MKNLRWMTVIFWYLFCAYVVMMGLNALMLKWSNMNSLPRLTACFGLALLLLFFIVIHLAIREIVLNMPEKGLVPENEQSEVTAFPSTSTVLTGVWLFIATTVSLFGLFWSFNPPMFLKTLLRDIFKSSDVMQEAMVMMFAAAIGSMITTILGYLDHASYKGNFKRSFIPWYFGRPLMGMLLGLVFYFIMKGGLWTVTPAGQDPPDKLNLAGLAGIGALVGMFSKNAIEKLREFFHGLFRTEKGMTEKLIESLPEDLQKKVKPHWMKILGEDEKSDAGDKGVLIPPSSTPNPIPTPKPSGKP